MKFKKRILLPAVALMAATLACIWSASESPAIPAPNSIQPPVQAKITQVVVEKALTTVITDEDAVLIDLYQRINPAVVSIVVYTRQGNLVVPEGQGSGFVFDGQGRIITNAHVIHGAEEVEVGFADGTILAAKILGEDLHSDLAVIQVEQLPPGVDPLPLGNIDEVAVGQTVIAIGNPFGLGGTLTRGIVSAIGRTIPALTPFQIPQAIQTDAPINPGNSGGPLLNLKGEVIGVNAQIETGGESRSNSGVGFAIPVSIVAHVVPDLIEQGEHQWPWLGVTGGSVTPALVQAMELPVTKGAYIAQVLSGGPADDAGLRGANREELVNGRQLEVGGDVIIAIDGVSVSSFDDILIYMALNSAPGQEVTLTIIRNGKEIQVKLILGLRPSNINENQFRP